MKRRSQSTLAPLTWFSAGILCGLLASAFLFYYQLWPSSLVKRKVATVQVSPKQRLARAKTQTPHFDFYNMLDEKDAAKEPNNTVAAKPKNYFIQVASFANHKEADRLKASLLLNGFNNVQIKTFTKDKTTVYRLVIGPYTTKTLAQTAQVKLKSNHLNSILVNSD